MPPHHPYIKQHVELLKSTRKGIQVWPMATGSAPFYIFQDKFNIVVLEEGWGMGVGLILPMSSHSLKVRLVLEVS